MEPRGREDGTPNIYWFIPRVPLGSAPRQIRSVVLQLQLYCKAKVHRLEPLSHAICSTTGAHMEPGNTMPKTKKPPKICSILQIPNATFVILLHHSNSPTSSAQPSWVHDVDSYMEPGRVDVTPNIYMLSARLKNIFKKKLECVFDLHSQTLNSLISLCLHFLFSVFVSAQVPKH